MAYIYIVPEGLSDEELVVKCLKEPESFGLLMQRYELQLANYVRSRFTTEPEQVKDIVQESFVKAYLSLPIFDHRRKWRPWIFKITMNVAYSYFRFLPVENIDKYKDIFSSGECLENNLDRLLKTEQINRALSLLSQESRQVVVLSYKGLTLEEISIRLVKPLGIIKARFNRAKMELIALMNNLH